MSVMSLVSSGPLLLAIPVAAAAGAVTVPLAVLPAAGPGVPAYITRCRARTPPRRPSSPTPKAPRHSRSAAGTAEGAAGTAEGAAGTSRRRRRHSPKAPPATPRPAAA